MTRILVVLDHYLPGFKAGGPIRSVSNMVEALKDEMKFSILTRDRDFGDAEPYVNVRANKWQFVGSASVFYMSDDGMIARVVRDAKPDVIYLNSFFSRTSIRVALLRRLGRLPRAMTVLAPRGEFADGALQFGPLKKAMFFLFARISGMYKGIVWHATTEGEIAEIERRAPAARPRIVLAPLFTTAVLPREGSRPVKQRGKVRAAFASRISPKKNLDGVLRALAGVRCHVVLDIIGPNGGDAYWAQCQKAIAILPANVTVNYRGALGHDDVLRALADADLFMLPTHGENHGHAIVEALAAGCPVLISDRTPWRNLAAARAGWDVALNDDAALCDVVERVAAMDDDEHREWRQGAESFAGAIAARADAIERYKELFAMKPSGVIAAPSMVIV